MRAADILCSAQMTSFGTDGHPLEWQGRDLNMMPRTEKTLKDLLHAVTKESKASDTGPFSGSMWGLIPKRLIINESQPKGSHLVLTPTERESFDATLGVLREEPATEYLSDKELEDKLWFLVCEVALNRPGFKKPSEIIKKIEDFLAELLRPIEQYEVMFRILNFDANTQAIHIWDSIIKRYTGKELKEWGIGASAFYRRTLVEFKNRTLIVVKEKGNNPSLVLERATKQADFKLTALRVYLSEQEFLKDEQLLFELGDHAAVRRMTTGKVVLQSWKRGRKPLGLSYYERLTKNLKEASRQFDAVDKLEVKLQGRVERAIYWIGRGIVETSADLKVSSLCTAMETLLTSISDKRKGEAIAYRMVLLEALLENSVRHPGDVLWIYKLRNNVVHGSSLGDATDRDYYTMVRYARQTLKNYVNLITQQKIRKQGDFFRVVETSTHSKTLLEWLANFSDKESREVREALRIAIDSHAES